MNKYQLPILLFNLTLGSILTMTPSLAESTQFKREITAISWEGSPQTMECEGNGTEYFLEGGNVYSNFRRVIVTCQDSPESNQASWVVIGGIGMNKGDEADENLETFYPDVNGHANRPNRYGFKRFVMGKDCTQQGDNWQCRTYLDDLEGKILHTYGEEQLSYSIEEIPMANFVGIDEDRYNTTDFR